LAKKSGATTFEGPLFSAYIFKAPYSISISFGTLQRHFILNTSVDAKISNLSEQSGAT